MEVFKDNSFRYWLNKSSTVSRKFTELETKKNLSIEQSKKKRIHFEHLS
jgi:hypothetical protein